MMIEDIDELVTEYYRTNNSELVKAIYLKTREYVDEWIRLQASSLRGLSEEARQDLALTFVNNVIRKSLRTNVKNHIRNLINERAKHDRISRIYQFINSGYRPDVDTQVRVLTKLDKSLKGLPIYVRGSVLYLIRYPEQINRFLKYNSVIVSHRVLKAIFDIRKSLNMSTSDNSLPESHVAKMLLLSNIYKSNPMALAVFLEVKSIEKFYQLCKLAESNQLSLPSTQEFNTIVEQSMELGSKLDSGSSLSVRDRQVLSLMATKEIDVKDVTPSSEIVPILAQYFVKSISTIIDNYTQVQDRVLASLDTSDPEKVKKMYVVLNKEVTTQVRLIEEIIGAISTSESLNKVLNKLETKLNGDL